MNRRNAVRNEHDSRFGRSIHRDVLILSNLRCRTHQALLLAISGTVTNASTLQAEVRSHRDRAPLLKQF